MQEIKQCQEEECDVLQRIKYMSHRITKVCSLALKLSLDGGTTTEVDTGCLDEIAHQTKGIGRADQVNKAECVDDKESNFDSTAQSRFNAR